MAQLYDDQEQQDTKQKFDDLMAHNINPGEERKMEKSAKKGAREDLKDAEERPHIGTPPSIADKLKTPEQIKDFEDSIGLHTPGGAKRMRGLTLFQRHKKGIIAGGVSGSVALTLISAVFFLVPSFRIPSAMSLITNVVGEAAEEIVENRAQRMIVAYLISKAGGTPGNYVITDSLLGSLWATFKLNRLEDKIKRQTGLEIQRVGDAGRIRIVHDGRPLDEINCRGMGSKKCIDTVIDLSYKDKLSRKDIRKMVRLSVPAWRFIKASKMAKYMRIKYGIPRFGTPKTDDAMSDEEKAKLLRTQQVDLTLNNTLPKMNNAITCVVDDENCDKFNENNEPIDTKTVDHGDGSDRSVNQVTGDLNEAASSAKEDVIKNGGSLAEKMTEKIVVKLVGEGTGKLVLKAIPVVGWIDLGSMINHMTIVAATNQIAARIPAVLAAAALAPMYAQWQGYGDELRAGRMIPLYVGLLSTQLNGKKGETAPLSSAHKFAEGEDPSKGIPVETRVNDNLKSPMDDLMANVIGKKRWADPLEWWYYTIGFLFRAAEGLIGWLLQGPVRVAMETFNHLMTAVFGENWLQELMASIMSLIFKILAISVDPLATGAKMFGQLYAGADVAINSFARTNLGARAISKVFDKDFFCTPVPAFNITQSKGCSGATSSTDGATSDIDYALDNKLDMAALPLSDRLLSMDEPQSLINQAVRAAPVSNNPAEWLGSILGQVASLPAKLFSLITGDAYAYHGSPEEKAAIAGVRQYGATAQDLDQDIAAQVRTIDETDCPDNDPEKYFNVCQADKEVVGSLMCVYTDCPEFQDGSGQRPGSSTGWIANLEQIFVQRQTATMGVW